MARVLAGVRGIHKYWLQENLTNADPAASVKPPKAPRRLPKAITVEQVEALLNAVSGDDPIQVRDRAILELLYATGARITEIVSLDLDDLVERTHRIARDCDRAHQRHELHLQDPGDQRTRFFGLLF